VQDIFLIVENYFLRKIILVLEVFLIWKKYTIENIYVPTPKKWVKISISSSKKKQSNFSNEPIEKEKAIQ